MSHHPRTQVDMCLAAAPSGVVSTQPCSSSSPALMWEVVAVGGDVGHRLRNRMGGCMSITLGDTYSHQLRADGSCTTPVDWLWSPDWEHGSDCSLMQYCGYPTNSTGPGGWAHNVCAYDQSCVVVSEAGVRVDKCDASTAQRFAFI